MGQSVHQEAVPFHGSDVQTGERTSPPHPTTRGDQRVTRVQLRNATHLHLPRCRTQTYQASFLPYASRLWNQLPQSVREARSITIFKNMCRAHLLTQQKHQLTRRHGPRYENILAARNRMNCI
ncbi:hypothetical protein Bbelb_168750 [Branchiostoma belcheri]|nr:hypothetical protein Bbelb_168750 [Branchiostoma belcheri]